MNIVDVVTKRYSTKKFDSAKKITETDVQKIKALLRFSPSSVNSQPWHFIIASTNEAKAKISKSTEGTFIGNHAKVMDASHVVVFCAKTEMNGDYLSHILEKEDADGRFSTPEMKKDQFLRRGMFVDIHRYDAKDVQHWMEKQVYLNMGMFLLGVGALGIDAVPMEGFDAKILDEQFQLREKGFTSVGVVSLGFKCESDANATLPKSRLNEEEMITEY